jgi:hypothetical protein
MAVSKTYGLNDEVAVRMVVSTVPLIASKGTFIVIGTAAVRPGGTVTGTVGVTIH